MAKRYHQSRKDRMNERHGMEHYEEKKMAGYYEGEYGRRHQEMKDAGMIREDHSAIANMPQRSMIKEWPKSDYGMPEDLDDTITGIDRQMDRDNMQRRKHSHPHKY